MAPKSFFEANEAAGAAWTSWNERRGQARRDRFWNGPAIPCAADSSYSPGIAPRGGRPPRSAPVRNVVTEPFAKLPIGELADGRIHRGKPSIGFFQGTGDLHRRFSGLSDCRNGANACDYPDAVDVVADGSVARPATIKTPAETGSMAMDSRRKAIIHDDQARLCHQRKKFLHGCFPGVIAYATDNIILRCRSAHDCLVVSCDSCAKPRGPTGPASPPPRRRRCVPRGRRATMRG